MDKYMAEEKKSMNSTTAMKNQIEARKRELVEKKASKVRVLMMFFIFVVIFFEFNNLFIYRKVRRWRMRKKRKVMRMQ
jgi:hypothetical protein